ncbi:MAG: hypothetical protein AB2L07_10245 [Thermoanaerobaculaceae bacterium]
MVPDNRISKDAPAIYISFEGKGAAADSLATRFLEAGDSRNSRRPGKDVWLRLHNNSLWALSVTSLGMHTGKQPEMIELLSGTCVFAAADGMEVAIVYRLRREDGREIPVYPGLDMFWTTWLPPGRSVLFSIPHALLPKKWVVAIPYNYEWEDVQTGYGGGPVHSVEFWSYRLPR